MADHAFVRAGRGRTGEHLAQRRTFRPVVQARAGAMRVDPADLRRVQAAVVQRGAYRRRRPRRIGRREVRAIRAHADAGQLRQDDGAAPEGVLPTFQHQDPCAFPEHQARAVAGERPAGVGAEHPQGLPALEHAHHDGGVGAAGQHHVGPAKADRIDGAGDGMVGRGAGGRDGIRGAVQPELHRQVGCRAIRHDPGHRQRVRARGALTIESIVLGIEAGLADDRGEDDGPAVRLGRIGLQPCLLHRLPRRHDGQLRTAVERGRTAVAKVGGGIEAGHLGGDDGGQPVGRDAGDRRNAASPGLHRRPDLGDLLPQRADCPQPGNGDALPARIKHQAAGPPPGSGQASPGRGSPGRRQSGTLRRCGRRRRERPP